jgi:signal transduction histidine kinase
VGKLTGAFSATVGMECVTKGLVEAHGRGIRVESAGEGKGATFIVTLPRREI